MYWLVVLAALAVPPKAVIQGPETVRPGDLVILSAVESIAANQYAWALVGSEKSWLAVDGGQKVVFASGQPGRYTFVLAVASSDGQVSLAQHVVTIGSPEPMPPGPGPGPQPPGPGPQPPPEPPAPIPLEGLRVLIVYETGQTYPPGQMAAIYGGEIRALLDAKCAVGPDGKTREYRIWDQDVDPSGAAAHWRDALKRPRQSLPWLIISNGRTGYEGPLPGSRQETVALIERFAR